MIQKHTHPEAKLTHRSSDDWGDPLRAAMPVPVNLLLLLLFVLAEAKKRVLILDASG